MSDGTTCVVVWLINMWFQKTSILSPTQVIDSLKGRRGFKSQNFRDSMKLNRKLSTEGYYKGKSKNPLWKRYRYFLQQHHKMPGYFLISKPKAATQTDLLIHKLSCSQQIKLPLIVPS